MPQVEETSSRPSASHLWCDLGREPRRGGLRLGPGGKLGPHRQAGSALSQQAGRYATMTGGRIGKVAMRGRIGRHLLTLADYRDQAPPGGVSLCRLRDGCRQQR